MASFATLPAPETVLVVDDDQDMCWVLEIALAGLGCAVTTVGSAQNAISSVAGLDFPIAFVDARLPDMDGLRLIEELRRLRPAMRIIMISGYYLEDDMRISEAMRACEIDGFLAKPFQIDAVAAAVTGKGNGKYRP
ncbi:response regulator [Methylocapsa polymorpha]|uniref:Response regulator n=1 Tax=Methylocapsa polymorpha TaxID=3080828 RepID=A0ABZ0HNN5_9HYPH|nr:response regulator [Methylocapsa sp. RX1]